MIYYIIPAHTDIRLMIIEPMIPQSREALFIRLYQDTFPGAASFVKKMGGNLEEAKDIFQDALVIYYEKSLDSSFTPGYNEQAYITGICKHLWYKRHRDLKMELPLDEQLKLSDDKELSVSVKLMQLVELSGKKCLDLLKAFYYDKLNMKDLSQRFGFSGERSATVQKYKCLEKVRNEIQQRSLNKDDFYE